MVALIMKSAARLSPFRERVIPALIPLIRQRWAATCPTCGRPLVFTEQYSGWFCYSCRRYAAEPASMGTPYCRIFPAGGSTRSTVTGAPPIARPGTKYCINCRFLVPEASRYCSRCGAVQS
jgi:ribosomal protein L37AE/L43A